MLKIKPTCKILVYKDNKTAYSIAFKCLTCNRKHKYEIPDECILALPHSHIELETVKKDEYVKKSWEKYIIGYCPISNTLLPISIE